MNATPPPIQPSGPNDPHGNDGDSHPDPAMDSLLREWLGEDTPPNLLRNLDAIHLAAKNHSADTPLFTNDELIAAVNRAFKDVDADRRGKSRVRTIPTPATNPLTRWGALAVAASILGVIAVHPFWRSREAKRPLTTQIPTQGFPPIGSGSESLFENKPPVLQAKVEPPIPPMPRDAVAAIQPIDKPSADVEPKADMTPEVIARSKESRPRRPSQTDSQSEQQVVAVIDQQLEHLWDRLKITPGKLTDPRALEDRLAWVLMGRLPTDTEREWGRKTGAANPSLDAARALSQRWIESEEFDRHWAKVLSDYYLDLSAPIDDKDAIAAFDAWLQESIQRNESLGQIEGRLVSSDVQGNDPSAFWLRRWIAAGEKSNAKLLAASGRSPAGQTLDQWSALETLALQGSRISGVPAIPFSAITSETLSTETVLGNAAAFASVFNPAQPKPTDKKGLYVSDGEGRVTLVTPVSPDGKAIPNSEDPRAGLAKWFEDSSLARKPMIDFVWKRLVGQPLVPTVGLTNSEGFEDRKDLLDFLAQEAQTQQAGLRQIVSWIVMSSPISFESRSVNAQEFLAVDPSVLASLQQRTRLFASYPATTENGGALDRLNALSRWTKTSEGNASSGVLAQPATNPTGAKNPTNIGKQTPPSPSDPQTALAWTSDRITYEISNQHPYERIGQVSLQLAESSLDWETVVERVFLACLSRYPSAEERKLATELLDWSQGDRQLASKRLVHALLGHL
jgi:hypothetical protein